MRYTGFGLEAMCGKRASVTYPDWGRKGWDRAACCARVRKIRWRIFTTFRGDAMKVKIFLVDDHKMFRQALRLYLEREQNLDVAGEAAALLEEGLIGALQAAIVVRHGGHGHDGGA